MASCCRANCRQLDSNISACRFAARRQAAESGNVTFFLAVVLPVLLTLTVLLIDVSGYYSHRSLSQDLIDSIVTQASKALPDRDAARALIHSELALHPGLSISSGADGERLRIDSSGISLSVSGSYTASFAGFLPRVNGEPLKFRYSHASSARVVPNDYVFVIADGSSLRPPSHSAWGDSGQWAASKYWNFVYNPNPDNLASLTEPLFWAAWDGEWESDSFRRWATQHCFNPALSAVKLAAISLIDVFGASEQSRIGLVHTPGNDNALGYAVTRSLAFPSQDGTKRHAAWANYFEKESFTSDELCSFIASSAISDEMRYSLEDVSQGYGLASGATKRCELPGTGDVWGKVHFPLGKLSAECLDSVSLRQAVYWRASRQYSHMVDGANILLAIDQAYQQLLLANSVLSDIDEARARRGNLSAISGKNIIAITDWLFEAGSQKVMSLLDNLKSTNVNLIFVTLIHPGLAEDKRSELSRRYALLQAYAEDFANVNLYLANSPEELTRKVIPFILATNRQVVIRK